uniref:Si:ch73-27e22.6 n=2 Tax=Cyprinus carpio TaxID=7962 RepID=A0A8C1LJS4_CYPCA
MHCNIRCCSGSAYWRHTSGNWRHATTKLLEVLTGRCLVIREVDKRPENMVYPFVLFSLCLWSMVGVFGVDTDEMKSVSVMKGESVTLNPDFIEVQKYLLLQWKFGSTRIAEVNKLAQINSTYDGPDGRFRDRLKLDQTGSLTITNTSNTDSGLYHLMVVQKETIYIIFNVTVYGVTEEENSVSVMEGDPVTLNPDVTEIQRYLLIQWMFESTRIAEVNKLTQTSYTYDADGRFRDRLKLDPTGSLTITNTRTTDSGLYQLAIVNRETSYMDYKVIVYERSSSTNCVTSSCAMND